MASKGAKSILYKHSHVAYEIKGNEEYSDANFCPRGMSGGHQRSKRRILGPFFTDTQLLLGFLVIALCMRTGDLMCAWICVGSGAGICDGEPSTCSSLV